MYVLRPREMESHLKNNLHVRCHAATSARARKGFPLRLVYCHFRTRYPAKNMSPSRNPVMHVAALVALALAFGATPKDRPANLSAVSQTAGRTEVGGIQDLDEQQGPFAVGEQNYTVLLRFKRLVSASDPLLSQTLESLQIRDAAGSVAYEKSLPFAVAAGRFQQSVSASAERLSGKTGAGLVVHYTERTAAPSNLPSQASEFWQLFGLVNGKLAPLPKPATIGEGAASGPFMGVMMRAANGAVSVISQPDSIELRAWTGNFYVLVPLRVDWSHGGLAQGQRCMEMLGGGLREVGCDMRVEANRKPPSEEFTFVRLFTEAHENFGSAEHAVLQRDSKVEILGSSAITTWNEIGGRIQPVFSDVWLHVRIDNRDGWIHGEDDLAAVGLPAGSPAP